jgi:hypothetical protein
MPLAKIELEVKKAPANRGFSSLTIDLQGYWAILIDSGYFSYKSFVWSNLEMHYSSKPLKTDTLSPGNRGALKKWS